jgi:3-phosphoshikimate 1-carboxyvinyltransferase
VILAGPTGHLTGQVEVPGSKSLTNRALIAAAVAGGGVIRHPLESDDTRLLAEALEACGWGVDWQNEIRIRQREPAAEQQTAWLGDSGTGARLILALLAATPGRFVVDGSPRLRQRPMAPLVDALRSLGADLQGADDGLPVTIVGSRLVGGRVVIRPQVSSQFVSALMLAAPLMEDGLQIEVDGPLPSRPYVDLTVDILHELGVDTTPAADGTGWSIPPSAPVCGDLAIEGDWSAAAFFVSAAAVTGGRVEVKPITRDSRQGDRVVCDIVERAGVRIRQTASGVVAEGRVEAPLDADLVDAPDLFPTLSVVAAAAPPGSVLRGLDHLKHKESDRLSVMVRNLRHLGAEIAVEGSVFKVVRGLKPHPDAVRQVVAADDHRIAMAMAVAALRAGPLELDDPACVAKSFPGFWRIWQRLVASDGSMPTP